MPVSNSRGFYRWKPFSAYMYPIRQSCKRQKRLYIRRTSISCKERSQVINLSKQKRSSHQASQSLAHNKHRTTSSSTPHQARRPTPL